MRLVVGLGNPGKKYEDTRHNLGFLVVDALKENQPKDVILFKPQSFMNLSGQEVSKKVNFYRLKPEDLIVIYDDIDLPIGETRIRNTGSSAGHKGVQSIIGALNSEDFTRVRIGIGRPPEGVEAENYVLEKFNSEEKKIIEKAVDQVAEAVLKLLSKPK